MEVLNSLRHNVAALDVDSRYSKSPRQRLRQRKHVVNAAPQLANTIRYSHVN